MVSAPMSEFQLKRFSSQRQPQQLMSETNSEDRFFSNQLFDILNGIFHCIRISRAVRKKNTVRIHCEYLFRRITGGNNGQTASVRRQPPKDILFHAVIEHHNVMGGVVCFTVPRFQSVRGLINTVPTVFFFCGDRFRKIQAVHIRR